jgi:hypothetical protein
MAEQKSIAELWDVFKFRDDRFARKHVEELDDVDWDALRAELLECCKEVWDADGAATCIDIYNDGDKDYIRSYPQDSRFPTRFDSPATAKNYASAILFMAWELEQQQREKEVGNG